MYNMSASSDYSSKSKESVGVDSITEGTSANCKEAIPLIEYIDAECLLADKAHDTDEIIEYLEKRKKWHEKPKVNKELSVEELKSLLEKAHQRINELEMAL